MKKLMIAAAIVCAAAISQAASFNWTSGEAQWVDSAGKILTEEPNGKLVLVLLGTDGTADWSKATEVAGQVGTFKYSSKKETNSENGTYTFTYGATGTPQNNYVYGVMFKDGTTDELVRLADAATGAELDITYTISGLGDNAWSGSDFGFANANYTVASVPEPTSAMLLLLGVAGLALRRRRA